MGTDDIFEWKGNYELTWNYGHILMIYLNVKEITNYCCQYFDAAKTIFEFLMIHNHNNINNNDINNNNLLK